MFETNDVEVSDGEQQENTTTEDNDDQQPSNRKQKPRVTFSSDIEEYEEDCSINSNDLEEAMDDDDDKCQDELNQVFEQHEQRERERSVESFLEKVSPRGNGSDDQDAKMEEEKRSGCIEHIEEICEDIDVIKLDTVEETEIVDEMLENNDEDDKNLMHFDKYTSLEQISDSEDMKTDTNKGPEAASPTGTTANTGTATVDEEGTPPPYAESTQTDKIPTEQAKKPKPRQMLKKSSTPSTSRKSSISSQKSDTETKKTKINNHNHRSDVEKDNELLKIQLNFKCCCEHKYQENDRLPRYKGYFSQYGLSKEELEARAVRKEHIKKLQYERWVRANEEKQIKSQINENAYAQWLREKLRKVRNKEKNMYNHNNHKQRKTKEKLKHSDSWK